MDGTNHQHTCDDCDKVATFNYQNDYHTYKIDNDGDFEEVGDPQEGNENHFFCEEHLEKYLSI